LWEERNREHVIVRKKAWYEANKEYVMWRDTKRRAKKLGIQFNLELLDIVIPERCPIFDVKLKVGNGPLARNSATLDRINPRKGYVKGNVAVISMFANKLKANGSAQQHLQIAEWMMQFLAR
jgi:hypothetical protein